MGNRRVNNHRRIHNNWWNNTYWGIYHHWEFNLYWGIYHHRWLYAYWGFNHYWWFHIYWRIYHGRWTYHNRSLNSFHYNWSDHPQSAGRKINYGMKVPFPGNYFTIIIPHTIFQSINIIFPNQIYKTLINLINSVPK